MVKAWRESKLGGEDEAHGRFYRSKPPLPKVFRRANKTGPPPLPPSLEEEEQGWWASLLFTSPQFSFH
jgi:hypothetical protein